MGAFWVSDFRIYFFQKLLGFSGMNKSIKISRGNSKIPYSSISLLSGHTCPGADKCKAMVNLETRKLIHGSGQMFTCFSAIQEGRYPDTMAARKHNTDVLMALKDDPDEMAAVIDGAIPKTYNKKAFRIHVAGDFFHLNYLKAWMKVAEERSDIIFYGYTKSIPLLIKAGYPSKRSDNFRIVASMGGKFDKMAMDHGLIAAHVFFFETIDQSQAFKEKLERDKVLYNPRILLSAEEAGMEIDHDDSHAIDYKEDFGLLLHGSGQQRGTPHSKAIWMQGQYGIFGYNRKKRVNEGNGRIIEKKKTA